MFCTIPTPRRKELLFPLAKLINFENLYLDKKNGQIFLPPQRKYALWKEKDYFPFQQRILKILVNILVEHNKYFKFK